MIDLYVTSLENLYTINAINRKELLRFRDKGKDVNNALQKQAVSEKRLLTAIDNVATLYAKILNDE